MVKQLNSLLTEISYVQTVMAKAGKMGLRKDVLIVMVVVFVSNSAKLVPVWFNSFRVHVEIVRDLVR
jgi:hypothetical protein